MLHFVRVPFLVSLLCALHLVASSLAAIKKDDSPTVPLQLNPTSSLTPNTTVPFSSGRGYRIPKTPFLVLIEEQSTPSALRDTLILLVEAVFSATEMINAGGEAADDPVEVFQHLRGDVQLQMVGYHDLLTPFKTAQIFQGMAVAGGRLGYWHSSLAVLEDGKGLVARVHIR